MARIKTYGFRENFFFYIFWMNAEEERETALFHPKMTRIFPGRGNENTLSQAPVMAVSRRCRDIPVLILFLAYWVVMFVVASSAVSNGDPYQIVYERECIFK
jgi:hypothetical protein